MKTIVSLTSFPAAISYAADAIRSILNGSVLPDKVVLYLAKPQFPDGKIPAEIAPLIENPIFEVRFTEEDTRSYKKLVPALTDFPDDIIVTIDDDARYHPDMLRILLEWHAREPHAIFAHRAKRMKFSAPYRKWRKYRWYHFLFKRLHRNMLNIQTGVGGVLYPPHSLDMKMIDSKLFMSLAPTQDDIYFWAAATSAGTPIIPVPFGKNKPKGLGKPRELTLKSINFKSGKDRNSEALWKIIGKFPDLFDKVV